MNMKMNMTYGLYMVGPRSDKGQVMLQGKSDGGQVTGY